jgi:hypothetical protein
LAYSSKKLFALAFLILIFFVSWGLATCYNSFNDSQHHPQQWWYLVDGSNTISVKNAIANGTVLVLGSNIDGNSSMATWNIVFPEYKSIESLNPDVILIFPFSTWSSSPDSIVSFYLNGVKRTYTYNVSTEVPGLGTVYGLGATPDPIDNNLHVLFPKSALEPTNNVTVVIPPYSIAYVSPVNLLADATSNELSYTDTVAQSRALYILPVFVLIFLVCLVLAYRKPLKVVLLFTGGMASMFLIAPFTEHIFDIEVAKRTVEIFYSTGSLNLGTFSYGPLWLFTNVAGVSPVFAFGGLPGDFVLNLFLKVPAILADGATFILLYSLLSKVGLKRPLLVASLVWLFNPLVFWTTAVHGMYSSIVALIILSTIYVVKKRPWLSALLIGVGGAFLPVVLILIIPLLLINRRRLIPLLSSAVLGFIPAYFLPYFIYENGLFTIIHNPLLGRTGLAGQQLVSNESYQYLVFQSTGVSFNFVIGVILATVITIVYLIRVKPTSDSYFTDICRFLTVFLIFFFLTYPTLYFQHIVWFIPLIAIVSSLKILTEKPITTVLLISLLFLAVILTTPYLLDTLQAIVFGSFFRLYATRVSTAVSNIYPIGYWIASFELPILIAFLTALLRPLEHKKLLKIIKFLASICAFISVFLVPFIIADNSHSSTLVLVIDASLLLLIPAISRIFFGTHKVLPKIGEFMQYLAAFSGIAIIFSILKVSEIAGAFLLLTYVLLAIALGYNIRQILSGENVDENTAV